MTKDERICSKIMENILYNSEEIKIELSKSTDISYIIEILKQRCDWLKKNNMEQWGDWYCTTKYNTNYFKKAMEINKFYIVKQGTEVKGGLLKNSDKEYWNDNEEAYYIHHFATKLGLPQLGVLVLNCIENIAKANKKSCIRLDCMQSNKKLNKYYKDYGFENVGFGDFPYKHNLWEKKITQIKMVVQYFIITFFIQQESHMNF